MASPASPMGPARRVPEPVAVSPLPEGAEHHHDQQHGSDPLLHEVLLMATDEQVQMTTYKRADGRLLADEWTWTSDMETVEAEADAADEPTEFVEEVWVRQSVRTFTLPTCNMCDEPAQFWGLCEKHAREDDPDYFEADLASGSGHGAA